jgi:hypothetical protein
MSDDTLKNQPIVAPPKQTVHAVQWPSFMDILHTAMDAAVEEAHAHVQEVGHNAGQRVGQYQSITGGSAGDSWCADFVSWCLMVGLARRMGWHTDEESMLTHVGEFGRRYMPISGYCPTLWNEAHRRGYARDNSYRPDSGDLILYDFGQVGEPHHVGIVIFQDRHGIYKTVEGNTSSGVDGSQSDGDGVFIRYRKPWRIHGFIHGHKEIVSE